MKSIVTKITKMDRKDSYGNTSFVVEFKTGEKGYYTSKNENQNKFVVGQEADFNIEEKQGSKGVYYKITVPQSEGKPFGGKPAIDPKTQMISFSASYTKDIIVAGKAGLQDFEKVFNQIYNVMISKL